MLSFLAIAAKQRFIVDAYVDKAVGIMEEIGKDKYAVSRVTLYPEVSFSGTRRPSLEELQQLHHLAHEQGRFEESVRRAGIYRAAGADCVFFPGLMDAETIGALVRAIAGPVNVTGRPGAPGVAELRRLGVARVSLGSAIARAALTTARDVARELLEEGTYRRLEGAILFDELDGSFSPP